MTRRGRSPDKVVINLRMSRAVRTKLDELATRMEITRSELIGMFIDIGLEASDNQIMPPNPNRNGEWRGRHADHFILDEPVDEHDHHTPVPGAPGIFAHATVEQPEDLPGLEEDETEKQERLSHSIDRAILEVVQDAQEAELGAELDAMALAEFAPNEPQPHVHGPWAQLFGSEVEVGGIRHATFMCGECGQQKFDAVH